MKRSQISLGTTSLLAMLMAGACFGCHQQTAQEKQVEQMKSVIQDNLKENFDLKKINQDMKEYLDAKNSKGQ